MAAIFSAFLSGLVSDNPLASGATTLNSSALANLPAVAAPNFMWLTLDPNGVNGLPEIVQVTAHTASATSCTIVRGQQTSNGGNAAHAHILNTVWVAGVTPDDMGARMDARYMSADPAVKGVVLTDAAQSIPDSAVTDITWGTEVNDPDGWTAGGIATLTVPAGKGGRYIVSYSGICSSDPGLTAAAACLINGSIAYVAVANRPAFTGAYLVTFVRTLAVGDTLKFQVYQTFGSALNVVSRLEIG